MKISLKWLNELVDVENFFSNPEELAALLTSAGLEVEDMQDGAKNYAHVVVGQVISKDKHPDADKLSLCQISTGDGQHQIICGAKNHKAGDKVVVALPGAVLPGDFKIKKSKIRGVESNGMLCSLAELAMPGDADGIIILPEQSKLGEKIADFYGLNDVVFELKVTPNRADCLSHIGLAREVGSLLKREVKMPKTEFKISNDDTQSVIALDVKQTENCPRFTGRYFKGVKVKESPEWLKNRLEALGINSINNVVDITNFVMLEYGQPMHAYDVTHIGGNKIQVDLSVSGEKFVTFDGTELSLDGSELTIRDAEKCIGLAGIIGGKNSGVSESTQDIFLECAYFMPAGVRRTSRKWGIETDACYRFARGVDPSAVMLASERAASLIQELCEAEVYANPYDFYPNPIIRRAVEFPLQLISDRLGYKVDEKLSKDIFLRLGCKVEQNAEKISVLPPLYRWDLEQDMDFVEEIGRVNGYDKIPERLPVLDMAPTAHTKEYLDHNTVADIFSGLGYLQAVNYAFVSSSWQDTVTEGTFDPSGFVFSGEAVALRNPLNEELNVMRKSLLPGLLKNLEFNYSHGNEMGRLFEIGRAFSKNEKGIAEINHLASVVWGEHSSMWTQSSAPTPLQLNAGITDFFAQLGIRSVSIEQWGEPPAILHPGQAAKIKVEGKYVGYLGAVHPDWLQRHKIRASAGICELNLDMLMQRHPRAVKFSKISRFPAVERDIAFVVPDKRAVSDISGCISKAASKLLKSVEVVDSFSGESVLQDHRSVTFRMKFQDLDATLDDSRVNDLQSSIIDAVKEQFSVSVR